MLLARFLDAIIGDGDLGLIDAAGKTHRFGNGEPPRVTIRVKDKAAERRLLVNPRLALGEIYMDGTLTIEEGTLFDLFELIGRNIDTFEHHWFSDLTASLSRLFRRIQQYNPVGKAQQNVAHHYDLSDDLYDLFLDSDRQYSCAYFDGSHDDLDRAQKDKKRHIAAKLLLDEPGKKVLDIGSGWGGMALYLAKTTGADVTGVTLSKEQHKVSEQRAADAGLSDRVRFKLQDYRDEPETFDRIVSVGMFEHVGAGHYLEYFRKTKQLLADDGVFLLHSIGRMQTPGNTNPWLRKYIFPGGYTPALSETLSAIEKAGLWVTDIEILRLHYADTLHHWYDRFMAQRDKALALYDERFCRMWEFYLIGCEISFRHMGQMVFQIQIAKRQDSVPLTRDYITDWERQLAQAETKAAE
ncbi:MAG: SAM-dependent methyltransferase [Rhodospirillaceae bacterium]|nr:SAM-dependent methyltransferase [Rhodospirillaceae bacterium]|tara:strand:+ start:3134 stop:4366 length:1233 start_codon:yes stop_codon:yes gene_type:complete